MTSWRKFVCLYNMIPLPLLPSLHNIYILLVFGKTYVTLFLNLFFFDRIHTNNAQ